MEGCPWADLSHKQKLSWECMMIMTIPTPMAWDPMERIVEGGKISDTDNLTFVFQQIFILTTTRQKMAGYPEKSIHWGQTSCQSQKPPSCHSVASLNLEPLKRVLSIHNNHLTRDTIRRRNSPLTPDRTSPFIYLSYFRLMISIRVSCLTAPDINFFSSYRPSLSLSLSYLLHPILLPSFPYLNHTSWHQFTNIQYL